MLRNFGRIRHAEIKAQTFHVTSQKPQPLPRPEGNAPYHLDLANVLPTDEIKEIIQNGYMRFHAVGDTGGVLDPHYQMQVAELMANDIPSKNIRFFYHLGDVVYFYGQSTDYYGQFYDPYVHYAAPIFAIPGNHDGEVQHNDDASLHGFTENFCSPYPQPTHESGDSSRDAMTQPNVYWTLETPFATIIGLYTNVPEGGYLDKTQISWLKQELYSAPKEKVLIIAMHHPIYSFDIMHSGSKAMSDVLDYAITSSGRTPDVVLAGHVHNYQRFSRKLHGKSVQYIVAGSGGYHHLHPMVKNTKTPFYIKEDNVTLEAFNSSKHGYLTLEASSQGIRGIYSTVDQEAFDAFTLLI
ncbi:MAG TPA: metallophosphoesterase [Cyclobacteriaceae bacterium]|jgi:predicted phosphodiesterase|nr:metallophosphoesterase [Cyclobacteriaceae bacterium]